MKYSNLQQVAGIHRQKGLAVVESAIVLPLVIFIMLAVGEIANAILQYNTLTQTTRDAARYIAEVGEANTGVIQLTEDKVDATINLVLSGKTSAGTAMLPGLSIDDVSVTLVNGNEVLVEVEYDYQPIFFPNIPTIMGISGAGGEFTMHSEIVMRVL